MSLQIWLPFTKDIANYGLSNVELTKRGNPQITSGGKLGGCLINTDGYFEFTSKYFPASTGFTCCAWVYITDINKQNGLVSNKDGGPVYSGCLITNGKLNYWHYDDSWKDHYGNTTLNANTWYHVAFVVKSDTVKFYVNGEFDGEQPGTTNSNNALNIIAKSYSDGSQFSGMLNDFRLYDNVLSEKEIKEISKGLILHYPLDNIQKLNNVFNYPTFNTSSDSGGWGHWGPSGATATGSQNTNKEFIYNKSNTYSHLFTSTNNSYYILYQSPSFSGGYRSAQAIIKMADGSKPDSTHIRWGWNANVGTAPITTYTALGNGFWLMKCEGFRQDGTDNLVAICIEYNASVYISEAYLENDVQVCSDIFGQNNSNTVIDDSGCGNHGTLTGSTKSYKDAARYDYTTNILSDSYITTPYYPDINSDSVSFGGWFKFNKDEIAAKMATYDFETSPYEQPYATGNLIGNANYGGMGIIWKTNNILYDKVFTNLLIYINIRSNNYYFNSNSFIPDFDKWTHLYFVYDKPSNRLNFYRDGVLFDYANVGPLSDIPITNLFINYAGVYGGNGPGMSIPMKTNDIRVYSTALSLEDIQDLYKLSAAIYKPGDIHAFELSESDCVNLLPDYTDISLIQMSGWDGSKNYDSSSKSLVLTATNGWRTFAWDTSAYSGQKIYVDFDYMFTDLTNMSSEGANVHTGSTVWFYIDKMLDTSEINVWKRFRGEFTADNYLGIMIRGVDETGLSVTMKIKNMSVIVKQNDNSDTQILKTGVIQSCIFKEYDNICEIGKDTTIANEFIEM